MTDQGESSNNETKYSGTSKHKITFDELFDYGAYSRDKAPVQGQEKWVGAMENGIAECYIRTHRCI